MKRFPPTYVLGQIEQCLGTVITNNDNHKRRIRNGVCPNLLLLFQNYMTLQNKKISEHGTGKKKR